MNARDVYCDALVNKLEQLLGSDLSEEIIHKSEFSNILIYLSSQTSADDSFGLQLLDKLNDHSSSRYPNDEVKRKNSVVGTLRCLNPQFDDTNIKQLNKLIREQNLQLHRLLNLEMLNSNSISSLMTMNDKAPNVVRWIIATDTETEEAVDQALKMNLPAKLEIMWGKATVAAMKRSNDTRVSEWRGLFNFLVYRDSIPFINFMERVLSNKSINGLVTSEVMLTFYHLHILYPMIYEKLLTLNVDKPITNEQYIKLLEDLKNAHHNYEKLKHDAANFRDLERYGKLTQKHSTVMEIPLNFSKDFFQFVDAIAIGQVLRIRRDDQFADYLIKEAEARRSKGIEPSKQVCEITEDDERAPLLQAAEIKPDTLPMMTKADLIKRVTAMADNLENDHYWNGMMSPRKNGHSTKLHFAFQNILGFGSQV